MHTLMDLLFTFTLHNSPSQQPLTTACNALFMKVFFVKLLSVAVTLTVKFACVCVRCAFAVCSLSVRVSRGLFLDIFHASARSES